MSQFSRDIIKFNGIYKLPISTVPTLDVGVPVVDRLKAFKNILAEELEEIEIILDKCACYAEDRGYMPPEAQVSYLPTKVEILTDLADLLGDIQVYCASEMCKFGLDRDVVLAIIMDSNFSKLGADGLPIYDERGKVQKGPNYWKPEPKISQALAGRMAAGELVAEAVRQQEIADAAWKKVRAQAETEAETKAAEQ